MPGPSVPPPPTHSHPHPLPCVPAGHWVALGNDGELGPVLRKWTGGTNTPAMGAESSYGL